MQFHRPIALAHPNANSAFDDTEAAQNKNTCTVFCRNRELGCQIKTVMAHPQRSAVGAIIYVAATAAAVIDVNQVLQCLISNTPIIRLILVSLCQC